MAVNPAMHAPTTDQEGKEVINISCLVSIFG